MPISRREFLGVGCAALLEGKDGAINSASALAERETPLGDDAKKWAFAHYMIGQGTRRRNQSDDEWLADIRDARAYGIDGWQFNFGHFDGAFERNVRNCVRVLGGMRNEGANFRFFPSFDCNRGRVPEIEEVKKWFLNYYDHPNHFRLNGTPLLTAWQAREVGNDFFANLKEQLRRAGMPIAFVPWVATSGGPWQMNRLFEKWTSMDGYAPWVPGRRAADAAKFNSLAGQMCRRYGKSLMAGQGFSLLAVNKAPYYVDKQAGEAITEQMMPLIDGDLADARLLCVASWNDFGEDHHITPYPPWGPVGGKHEVWCHVGYSAVLKYYLDWWKLEQKPRIDRDLVAIFHLTQLAREGSPPFPFLQYKPDKAKDVVHLTAILKEAGSISITSGKLSPAQFEAPAGISHWRAPAARGKQIYSLARNGVRVFRSESKREIDSPPEGSWSWGRYSEVTISE